jgi:hypothetical protein
MEATDAWAKAVGSQGFGLARRMRAGPNRSFT